MANINSEPSMNGTTKPTDAGSYVRGPQWGIDATLSGYILQDISIAQEDIADITQDQKGAVVSELTYDTRETLNFTAIGGDGTEGAPAPLSAGQIDFSFNGKKWKVDSCTYAGNYADKKKYSVAAHRYINFPS